MCAVTHAAQDAVQSVTKRNSDRADNPQTGVCRVWIRRELVRVVLGSGPIQHRHCAGLT